MSEHRKSTSIGQFVNRAKEDPFFVGYSIHLFAQGRGFDDALTAEFLECDQHVLDRLRMCRCPDELSDSYKDDLQKVADHVSCSTSKLGMLLHEARGISVLAKSPGNSPGSMLLAARDRQEENKPSDSDEGENDCDES